jgi:hypothetical protein
VIYHGVVVHCDCRTLWGTLLFAPDDDGRAIIDAISAATIAQASRVAKRLRRDNRGVIAELPFHSTAVEGGGGTFVSTPGDLVQVILNADYRLVGVRYSSRS